MKYYISRLNFWKNKKYYNDYTLLENGSPIWCEAYVNSFDDDPYVGLGNENIIPVMLEHYNEYLKDKSVRKKYGYVW